MRLVVAGCVAAVAAAVSGCASTSADLPPSVGNGLGSQYGNYAAQANGEMTGPAGERCIVYDWDRPLTKTRALRLRSASCESTEHPGTMVARELSRTVIPMSESTLKDAPGGAGDGKAVP